MPTPKENEIDKMKFEFAPAFVDEMKENLSAEDLELINNWGFASSKFSDIVAKGKDRAAFGIQLQPDITKLLRGYVKSGNCTGIKLIITAKKAQAVGSFVNKLITDSLSILQDEIGLEQVVAFNLLAKEAIQVGNVKRVEAHIERLLISGNIDYEAHSKLMGFVKINAKLFCSTPYEYAKTAALQPLLDVVLMRNKSEQLQSILLKSTSDLEFATLIEKKAASKYLAKMCLTRFSDFRKIEKVQLGIAVGKIEPNLKELSSFLHALYDVKTQPWAKDIAEHAIDTDRINNGTRLLKALSTLSEARIDLNALLIEFVKNKEEQFQAEMDARGAGKGALNWTIGSKHTTKAQKFATLLETLQKGETPTLYTALANIELSGDIESSDPQTVITSLVKTMLKDEPKSSALFGEMQHAFNQARGLGASKTIADFEAFLAEKLSEAQHGSQPNM